MKPEGSPNVLDIKKKQTKTTTSVNDEQTKLSFEKFEKELNQSNIRSQKDSISSFESGDPFTDNNKWNQKTEKTQLKEKEAQNTSPLKRKATFIAPEPENTEKKQAIDLAIMKNLTRGILGRVT